MLGGGCRHMKQQLEDELKNYFDWRLGGLRGRHQSVRHFTKVFTWPALEVPGSGEEEGGGGEVVMMPPPPG